VTIHKCILKSFRIKLSEASHKSNAGTEITPLTTRNHFRGEIAIKSPRAKISGGTIVERQIHAVIKLAGFNRQVVVQPQVGTYN